MHYTIAVMSCKWSKTRHTIALLRSDSRSVVSELLSPRSRTSGPELAKHFCSIEDLQSAKHHMFKSVLLLVICMYILVSSACGPCLFGGGCSGKSMPSVPKASWEVRSQCLLACAGQSQQWLTYPLDAPSFPNVGGMVRANLALAACLCLAA